MFSPSRLRRAFPLTAILGLAPWFLAANAAAQSADAVGIIAGRVINEGTGMGVAGATLTVAELGQRATSDLSGNFSITDVPAGRRDLIVVKDGFQPATITGVQVPDDDTARLDVPIAVVGEQVIAMEAFTVAADIVQQSGLGLLLTRQRSVAVSDAIASDDMSRLALNNAADALAKTPGTSIVDGKYVVIRGLGDRYTNTQMNGSSVPSADPDRRAVQMDQFPSDLIDSVTTLKSFTPDQPGAFSGGSVNIKTKSFPEHFFVSASAKIGYNSNTTGEQILTVPGGGRDWQARDDGTRALPAALAEPMPPTLTTTLAQIRARQGDFGPAEELDRIANAFNNEIYFPQPRRAGPDHGYSFAFGDSHEFENGQVVGYVASFTWDASTRHYTDGITARYSQGSTNPTSPAFVDLNRVFTPNVQEYNFAEIYAQRPDVPGGTPAFGVTQSVQSVAWGAYSQLAWRPSLNHEVTFNFFHNQSADDQVKRGVGEAVRSDSGNEFRESYDLLYTERGVTSLQLNGRSNLMNLNDATLEWRAARSRSTQDQPDYRTFEFKWNFALQAFDPSGLFSNRYFRKLEEESTEFGLDYTQPFTLAGEQEFSLKVGGAFSDGDRTNRERAFLVQTGQAVNRSTIESYPGPVGIINRTANGVTFGTVMREVQSNLNYDGEQTLSAGYAMGDWRLNDRWRFIGGLRMERTELLTTPITTSTIEVEPGEIRQTDALPALAAVWSPWARQNLRLSYGRTLARPTYRELADVVNIDSFRDQTIGGNPDLELTLIDNLDLRWEWFPRGSEVVAVSLFYKKLDQPIEQVEAQGRIQPQNAGEGTVFGVELETRRRLGFLGPAFEPLSVGFNASLIESQVEIPADELALIRAAYPEADDTRELFGQSPYILNADLTYEVAAWRSTFTVAYSVFGERLALVNSGPLPDVYEQPAPALDLIYTQKLGRRWKLKFTARNLLDPAYEETLEHGGTTYFYERRERGRSFSLSVGYDFN